LQIVAFNCQVSTFNCQLSTFNCQFSIINFQFSTLNFQLSLTKEHTVIVISGPTAVGKTSFAIELAQHLSTEIISADSRQCYRELNIGVAKPLVEELKSVHHYFINSHSIHDDVNAGVFEQYALNAANTIFKSQGTAVMVGGTGLYIKAFCEGIDEIPAIDKSIRQQVIDSYEAYGIEYLQNELAQKDPEFWKTAEQQNPQRLMRALEVLLSTGKSIRTFQKGKQEERPFNIIKIGLELPREQLYNQINTRVDQMIEEGLLGEVKSLTAYKDLNALQTVGYKEIFEYLDGKVDLQRAINNIKTNTRHYAKRQLTWFKKDLNINWINPSYINPQNLIEKL
jgi:tRNA dimethylallyltransferase